MKPFVTFLLLALCASLSMAQDAGTGAAPATPFFDPQKLLAAQPQAIDASSKLDVQLATLLRRDAQLRASGAAVTPASLLSFAPTVSARVDAGVARVQIFLEAVDPDAAARLVAALGGSVYTRAGDVLTALVPLAAVPAVAASGAVARIEAATLLDCRMNVSRAEIRADRVHAGTGLPQAYTGTGVVVGVLDTGIDPAHPDFRTATGSRIQYLWDMSDSLSTHVNPPTEYGYGREYSKLQIDGGACVEEDVNGHGTHVAGTAAGNGRGDAAFTGIAPDADLIIVKGTRYGAGFSTVDVVNGCDYIFKRAARLGKPAVINLSLGGHLGPHDASGLEERGLDALTGPGRIIAVAAGNEGHRAMHVRYQCGGDETEPRVTFFKVDPASGLAMIDLWHSGSVKIGLAAYSSYPWLIGYTRGVMHGETLEPIGFTYRNMPFAVGSISNSGSPAANGLTEATIVVAAIPGSQDISDYTFALYTYGSGAVDAWMVGEGEFAPNYHPEYHIYPGDRLYTVGMPGTASTVVTVGSYVTKTQWVDINGAPQQQPNMCDGPAAPVVGQLSCFSGIGPTRDGRAKPEITAPGEMIFAAASSTSTVDDERMLAGGLYCGKEGTSMATPHVTGTIALMLQRNGQLTVDQVKTYLSNTARPRGATDAGIGPAWAWGSGKLDAYAAVLAVTPAKEGSGLAPAALALAVSPNPASGVARISYALPESGGVTLRVRDLLGRVVAVPEAAERGAGAHDVAFDVRSLPSGVYFCTMEAGGRSAVARLVVAGR